MSTTIDRLPRPARRFVLSRKHRRAVDRALLACGIGYGAAYVIGNDVVAAGMWDKYSRIDQAISELSGTEAPSKGFLKAMMPVFSLLVFGFGLGVWRVAGQNRPLRVTGGILVAQGTTFPLWLLFPMTSREKLAQGAGGSTTSATWF